MSNSKDLIVICQPYKFVTFVTDSVTFREVASEQHESPLRGNLDPTWEFRTYEGNVRLIPYEGI